MDLVLLCLVQKCLFAKHSKKQGQCQNGFDAKNSF
jgi:hypothetical protein